MLVWEIQLGIRELVLDMGIIAGLLVFSTWLRTRVALFRKFLIPVSLIAGFLGLAIGPELLKLVSFDLERMGVYVYHLLALTFIGVGLRPSSNRTAGAVHIGFIKVVTMIAQALIGLLIALLFLWLVSPSIVPSVGMLLPLGFGMGPGIAFSVGQSWHAYGFPDAANIGLTLAAIGFLIAYFSGIAIVNRGVERGYTSVDASVLKEGAPTLGSGESGSKLTFFSGAVDTLTFHIALVMAIYLLSYVVLVGLEKLLISLGQAQELTILWSFNFIVANLLAILVRTMINRTPARRVVDPGTTNRLTSFFADLLVTTAIMAISLRIAWAYIAPIGVMCVLGALVTYFAIKVLIKKSFEDHVFERTVGLFAEQTGTISSGLALIRVTDPELKTPVAQDQVLGSGFALALGFPMLLLINMPLVRYGGELNGYLAVLGWLSLYLAVMTLAWFWFYRSERNRREAA